MLSLSFEVAGAAADSLAHITLTGVACVVYLALVATIVGWAICGSLLQRYSPSVVAPFSLLVPSSGSSRARVCHGATGVVADRARGQGASDAVSTRRKFACATSASSGSAHPSARRSSSTSGRS